MNRKANCEGTSTGNKGSRAILRRDSSPRSYSVAGVKQLDSVKDQAKTKKLVFLSDVMLPLCQDFLPMIDRAEIDAKSEELGVHVANVQRDYVFGWLLAGLAQPENQLRPALIL